MTFSSPIRRRLRGSVAVFAALAMLLVACGNGDDPEPAAPAEPAPDEPEPEPEPDAPPFYEDASIRYIIPTAPGGGADAIAQFLNPYWTECLPGNPSVEIDYIPGAGGTAGANEFELRADHDGFTVMQGTLSSATAFLLGEEAVSYDMSDWTPVIAFSTSGMQHVSTDTGITSVQDIVDYDGELFMGGRAPTASDIMHVLAMEVLGYRDKVTHLWGYGGTGEQLLAFEQGETNIDGTTDNAWIDNGQRLMDEGLSTPILAYGHSDGQGDFAPHPQIDAPTVLEAYREIHGEDPSGEVWNAFLGVMDTLMVATVVVLPQDAPAEAVAAFREGVDCLVNETDFIESWKENLNPTDPITDPDRLEAGRQSLGAIDDNMRAWINEFLLTNYPDQMG